MIQRRTLVAFVLGSGLLVGHSLAGAHEVDGDGPLEKRWLAGDHHVHSIFSVGWDREKTPPAPILGGDAIYPRAMNALMGRYHGLSWMVGTDHGGPNHARINLELSYPKLIESRQVVPDIVQFYGMELNTPGGDHSSLILPHTHDEADVLHDLESRFDKNEAFPVDPARDDEARMVEALGVMRALPAKPVVIANHPSRSAKAYGDYGLYHPAEFRAWNDAAPEVAVGMAAAPGHQAITLNRYISDDKMKVRGGYGRHSTLGGFDQMTARVGGFWDSMLGEGRRWWVTANSDSHRHYTDGGIDFWPGEYSKTYVFAEKSYESILEALRGGHIFVTTGDLVSELYLEVSEGGSDGRKAGIGDEIEVQRDAVVTVTIRVRDPGSLNAGGQNPVVKRVDLIAGDIRGRVADPATNSNESARVLTRFAAADWTRDGELLTMKTTLAVNGDLYLRVRGTNTDQLEPEPDPPAEDPWSDLWFYSNPVFVSVP
ncbi:MAG: phosphoesterase [Proteobacteria bacterium]|jgi:hypothetical protein|nr:phosphoesterase [Pseudomonadota bacterium]MDA1298683.1 phosphoesterase [Pseudomonadota bacterium]